MARRLEERHEENFQGATFSPRSERPKAPMFPSFTLASEDGSSENTYHTDFWGACGHPQQDSTEVFISGLTDGLVMNTVEPPRNFQKNARNTLGSAVSFLG